MIILDDCAVSTDLKKRSNKFINLPFSGRHEGLSVTATDLDSQPFRENVACVVAFHNPSQIVTKTLFEDYGGDLNADTRKTFAELLKAQIFEGMFLPEVILPVNWKFLLLSQVEKMYAFKVYLNSFINMTSVIEDYVKAPTKEAPTTSGKKDGDIEVKRESLAILATIGNNKEFLGVNMSFGNVRKLSAKDVENYYVRYQNILGQRLKTGLVESGIQAASKIASYFLPIDDSEKLYNTWINNKLLICDLSTFAGFLALKGG